MTTEGDEQGEQGSGFLGPLLFREDYNPNAPPGKGGYDHAGRYCKICGRQTSFYRDHRALGPMYCTRCGVIESIGGFDVHTLIVLMVGIIKTTDLEAVDSKRSRALLKYATVLDGACKLREEASQ